MKIVITSIARMLESLRNRWRALPRNRQSLYAVTVLLLVAGGAGLYAWLALDDAPQPRIARVDVTAPGLSDVVEGRLRPKPVYIRFQLQPPVQGRRYLATPEGDPIARLDLVGKRVTTQITMTPFQAGDWLWVDERTLKFEPAEDWPAGEEFQVRLPPELFAPYVTVANARPKFKTPPFTAQLENFRFYQDPTQRSVRKAVATLKFSHPVDPAALEAALSLRMRPDGSTVLTDAKDVAFTTEYDSVRREVYIHSVPLELPEKQNYLRLTLDKNLKAERGPSRLGKELEDSVIIPDIGSFFRVQSLNASIVRNEEGDPEQTLLFDFTDRVHSETFAEKITAWVLPKDRQMQGRTTRDYRWESPREVTAEVLAEAKPVTLQANPTEDAYANIQSFRFDAPENRYLYIRTEKNLESESGFVIREGYDNVVRIPAYPKEARIAHEGAVMALTGSRRLSFVSRGVPALKVETGRVVPGQINHLVSQTSGDMSSPHFSNYQFSEDNITQRFEQIIKLAPAHPREAVYSSLNLDDYLPQEGAAGRGMFFVRVQGWDPDLRRALGQQDRRFILLTDLGLLAKENADGSHDLFVQSLVSGEPVAGATVELLGKNGTSVRSDRTDLDGHVWLNSARDLRREKEPAVFVARYGNDLTFMPYDKSSRRLELSGFDIGGEHTDAHREASKRVRAFMFSDRGIYRPGDGVHLGIVVKREDWRDLSGLPVELRIMDPRGNIALKQKLALPEDGFVSQDFPTQPASPTGAYQASLFLVSAQGYAEHQIGSAEFKVEEFQPDTMRIRTVIEHAAGKAWVKPGVIQAEVALENLFGLPAQNRRVAGDWRLEPASLYFSGYSGYRFEDPLRARRSAALTGAGGRLDELRSDEAGKATVRLELGRYDQGIYRLQLNVQGYEPGDGRSVRADASVMVSPLDHVVGWKADGSMRWLPRDTERNVQLVALGQDGKPLSLKDLKLRLLEQRYISTLVRQRDGTYAYQSTLKEELRKEEEFTLAAQGTSRRLDTSAPGEYVLSLADAAGTELARVPFTVVGEANLAGRLEKEAELDIKLEGSDFRKGETLRMQITAPYAGAGLITIERERVYAWKWFRAGAERSVQSIVVPQIEGNAYVHVAFVRDLNSPEVFTSPLSYAVAPFSVDRSERKVELTLEAPDKVKPGDTLTIAYTASRPSRVALFAVDEGILQVADYRTPDPLSFFFRKKALQVQTTQILDLVMPEYKLRRERAAAGGDAAAADLLGANLNPFGRKTEAPAVYWAGLVEAGPERRELVYQVPDYFNGKLRIMAVAAAPAAVGAGERHALVRGPFVLTPSVLTMAAPGDEFDVSVGVSNALEGSGPQAQVEVSAVPSEHLEIVGESRVKLQIGEGNEGRTQFRVKARDALGAASLTFSAHSGDTGVTRKATLSVRPPVAFETTTQAGFESGARVEVKLARALRPEFAEQTAAASASPMALADGLVAYLEHFPHGCAEQLVSRVFPHLGLVEARLYPVDRERVSANIETTLLQLRSRQNADGGFRFWPGPGDSAEFPSIYLMHFLTDSRQLGLPAPDDMLSAGLRYLQEIAAADADSIEAARMRAYAIYILTRNGEVTTNFLTHLHETLDRNHKDAWRRDLAAAYMAATYRMLQHTDLAQQLIGHYKMLPGANAWYSDFDTRLGRDAQYLYLLSRHFPERLNEISIKSLEAITGPVYAGDYNTLSASYASLGLGAYTAAQSDTGRLGPVTIAGRDDAGKPVAINAAPAPLAQAKLPHGLRTAEFSGQVDPGVFYVLAQFGFDVALPQGAVSEGLEIHREFLDDKGATISRAVIGDEITVRLRVRSTGEYRTNVAVIDLLPGGFEVLRDSVRGGDDGYWSMDYRDVREDRVVIYAGFGSSMTEISYRVKVTAAGRFTVPAATAAAMYDRKVRARSAGGSFEVSRVQ